MLQLRLCAAAAVLLIAPAASASPELARAKNCVACHHLERKMNGPAYKAIAEKYATDQEAANRLAAKVRAGGAGVWSPAPMPPQPQVTPEEAETLVKWILGTR
ncbi:MAG: c-type cytochrome [Beijerinckiaceae bacterium]